MSVTQKIVTSNFNVINAKNFVDTFSTDNYYMFVGKQIPYPYGDGYVTTPDDSVQSSLIDVYNNMIFTKKVKSTDAAMMIRNIPWTTNTVYQKYTHTNPDLFDQDFYSVVDDTTEYNVYKCIDNANSSASTIAPSRVGSAADLLPIMTGDGYIWKYMYTIPKFDYLKFSTRNFVPYVANNDVINGAIPGTVEVIEIESPGKGYNNYIENATFRNGDITVSGINTLYGAPETAVAIDDYYQGCVLKLISGAGINQYRRIVNYEGTDSQKKFTLDRPFTINPSVGDVYEVYPYVYVWGDGQETKAAEGRAIIDPVGNTVSSVEMLDVGENYRYGVSYPGQMPSDLSVSINTTFVTVPLVISTDTNFLEAQLTPIISPQDGHGSNPIFELDAKNVCVSVKLNQSESGSIPIENDFRQVGLIKDPLFSNVDLILKQANTIGNFTVGERVYQFKQVKLAGTVDLVSGNSYIIKTDQGKISTTVDILNAGVGYDSTIDNTIVFNNTVTGGSGATGTFTNNVSGSISSITILNQGSGYEIAPTVSINTSAAIGGSNAQFLVSLANPQVTTYDEVFEANDYVLVSKSACNHIFRADSIPNNYSVIATNNATANVSSADISSLVLQSSGIVSSASAGQISLTNVTGEFTHGSKIIQLSTGTSSVIGDTNSIQINDKSVKLFDTTVQLTRLVGNFVIGSAPFNEDEYVTQDSLVSYAKPNGFVHHIELNNGTDDDVLYISKQSGIFNLDPAGVKSIIGDTTGATLENLSNKYNGDFVKDSGKILYIENIDPITRSDNKSETIKLIFGF